ncbi:MAG: hypothetical protein VR64_03675 [Desulfatitalea sp. BRH_c12]|nr:MAG: hypothetical protein VR64_03675 [Desulfatitalea sp. BRH_c12]
MGKSTSLYILISLIGLLGVIALTGALRHQHHRAAGQARLSAPFYDTISKTWMVTLSMPRGVRKIYNAQEPFARALDMLANAAAVGVPKTLKIETGHYVFSRPLIFKEVHAGIALIGAPHRVRPLTRQTISVDRYRKQINQLAPQLPIIDGNGVTSFLVLDGVAADAHLATTVAGFYMIGQMAGLGGTYYPDFSYRIGDEKFRRKDGYYTRYAFNDGGVVSVLGNSSVTLENNIIDHPMAYQCGGVLRNEQYGDSEVMRASLVRDNLVINPFAWHTGAFVDNNTGAFAKVVSNQIVVDQQMPHPVGLITNFDGAFLVIENNRIVDARPSKQKVPTIGIRILGRPEGVIRSKNTFEEIDTPLDHIADGGPPFPPHRSFYFLIKKTKALKLLKTVFNDRQFVMPGHWPDEIAPLVRTRDFEKNNPHRIAMLKKHFMKLRANMQERLRS